MIFETNNRKRWNIARSVFIVIIMLIASIIGTYVFSLFYNIQLPKTVLVDKQKGTYVSSVDNAIQTNANQIVENHPGNRSITSAVNQSQISAQSLIPIVSYKSTS